VTVEAKMKTLLEENGMFPEQADAVMELAKADESLKSMTGRWQDDEEGYMRPILTAVWVAVRRCAVQWIDENTPKAWYRPMFAGSEATDGA